MADIAGSLGLVLLIEDDLAPTGAPSGRSVLARPGRRVVVVPAGQLHAAPDHLSPGYRVDVLAIIGALADLTVNVETILGYFEEDDEDETEEEDTDA